MPWRVETPMSQRQDFVAAIARGHWQMQELCARFEISRKTGYKWWRRYELGGLGALEDQSRRPRASPTALEATLGALLIRTQQVHPTWGPRKLLAYLTHRHPRYAEWPVASTVGALLKRLRGVSRDVLRASLGRAADLDMPVLRRWGRRESFHGGMLVVR